jgi:hypothetical protein
VMMEVDNREARLLEAVFAVSTHDHFMLTPPVYCGLSYHY